MRVPTARSAPGAALSDLLAEHWLDFPAAWISETSREQIERLCAQLPPLSGFGFEINCGQEHGRTDISLRLQTCDVGAASFSGQSEHWAYPPPFLLHPEWRAVQRYCQVWRDHPLTGAHHLQTAWLEVDHAELQKSVPVPCLYLGLWNVQRQILFRDGFLDLIHRTIAGSGLPPSWRSTIELQFERGTDRIERCWIGYMLSRPERGLRITRLLTFPQIERLFEQLWGTVPEALYRVVGALPALTESPETFMVHLDCGETVGPRVGIEVVPETLSREAHLVETGAVPLEETRRIARWCQFSPGADRVEDPNLLTQFPEPHRELLWTRQLSHYKLVFQPHAALQCKAYLGIAFAWL